MYQLVYKGNFFRKNVIPLITIIGIVLVGFYEIFLGGSFLLYEDHVTVSGYSYGDGLGNGWRPDKGLGISFFFGDPGMWHPWSIFSLWEKIAPSRIFAYNASEIILYILAAIVVYYFIASTVPTLGRVACLFSPLIVFCVLQQRQWITVFIGTPLLILLLHDYYKRPRVVHFFQLSFLSWFVAFFGNLSGFTQFLNFGFIFSVIYYIYFKGSIRKFVFQYVFIFSIAGLMTFLLGAWIFYSFFLEYSITGYMREKVVCFPQEVNFIPDLRNVLNTLTGLVQVEWLPANLELPGIGWRPLPYSVNVSVIFPLSFVFFLFRRSTTFWEHAMKWLLLVCIIHGICMLIEPMYSDMHRYIHERSSKLLNIPNECYTFRLQIGLLAIFIVEMKREGFVACYSWGRRIQSGIALLLFLLYSCMALFCVFAILIPTALPAFARFIINQFFPENIGQYSKELLSIVSSFNIESTQNVMHLYSFSFYLLSALLVSFFVSNKWFSRLAGRPTIFIAGMLTLNVVLFSWTIFPLNKKGLVWEQNTNFTSEFKPTDRFYFVNYLLKYNMSKGKDVVREFEDMFINVDGEGHREFLTGYNESPGLTFSSYKSFTQKEVGSFIYHMFNKEDGISNIKNLRDVTIGSLISNELLNMAAVNYYYTSRRLISVPEYLSLYTEKKQLYVYKNNSAWPYFYLAENMEIKENGKHLENVRQGTAYVSEKDFFTLEQAWDNSSIHLREFSYGKMVFDYEGDRDNFLVVADAWHPFWKARIEGEDLPVVKTNEIFKGVKLPPGKFDLTLYFDTSPYYPGIYISIFAWITFISGWFFVWKYNWNLSFFSSNIKTYESLLGVNKN